MAAVHARKKRIIAGFARTAPASLSRQVRAHPRAGEFRRPAHGRAGGRRRVCGSHFLIGTGSRVSVPPVPGLSTARILDKRRRSRPRFQAAQRRCPGRRASSPASSHNSSAGSAPGCAWSSGAPTSCGTTRRRPPRVVRRAFEDEGMEVHTGTPIVGVRSGAWRRLGHLQGGRHGRWSAGRTTPQCARAGSPPPRRLPENAGDQGGSRTAGSSSTGGSRRAPRTSTRPGTAAGPTRSSTSPSSRRSWRPATLPGSRDLSRSTRHAPRRGLHRSAGGYHRPAREGVAAKGSVYFAASHPFNDHGKSILMNANYGYVKVWRPARPDGSWAPRSSARTRAS